jgi:hypothetical protein
MFPSFLKKYLGYKSKSNRDQRPTSARCTHLIWHYMALAVLDDGEDQIVVFWNMIPYSLVGDYQRFGGRYCLHLLPWKEKAVTSLKTLVKAYHNTRLHRMSWLGGRRSCFVFAISRVQVPIQRRTILALFRDFPHSFLEGAGVTSKN